MHQTLEIEFSAVVAIRNLNLFDSQLVNQPVTDAQLYTCIHLDGLLFSVLNLDINKL
jgi:hypothetical protein